jgi:signal peptidase II
MMSPVRKTSRLCLMIFVLTTCIGCDQITKRIASEKLRVVPSMSFLGDTVRLQYAENTGAFLGLGNTLPQAWRFWLLTATTAILLAILLWMLAARWDIGRVSFTAVALILAGGLGNLIDRVCRNGVVIDFLNLGVGSMRTGIFNVADVAITTGVIILLVESLRKSTKTKAQT